MIEYIIQKQNLYWKEPMGPGKPYTTRLPGEPCHHIASLAASWTSQVIVFFADWQVFFLFCKEFLYNKPTFRFNNCAGKLVSAEDMNFQQLRFTDELKDQQTDLPQWRSCHTTLLFQLSVHSTELRAKVLRPTRHKTGHFRYVLTSQSLDMNCCMICWICPWKRTPSNKLELYALLSDEDRNTATGCMYRNFGAFCEVQMCDVGYNSKQADRHTTDKHTSRSISHQCDCIKNYHLYFF